MGDESIMQSTKDMSMVTYGSMREVKERAEVRQRNPVSHNILPLKRTSEQRQMMSAPQYIDSGCIKYAFELD